MVTVDNPHASCLERYQFRFDGCTLDMQERDTDRQAGPARPGAAGVDEEYAVALLDHGLV